MVKETSSWRVTKPRGSGEQKKHRPRRFAGFLKLQGVFVFTPFHQRKGSFQCPEEPSDVHRALFEGSPPEKETEAFFFHPFSPHVPFCDGLQVVSFFSAKKQRNKKQASTAGGNFLLSVRGHDGDGGGGVPPGRAMGPSVREQPDDSAGCVQLELGPSAAGVAFFSSSSPFLPLWFLFFGEAVL